ncbi:MAG: RsmB/NOP family class I SAM-dependent RNA methyltransferase [Sphingomonadales bacterium]|nr:RsmB/NOP family class I SAM-dependent RNA methyltransferase [Sphingomonadales bacterium]
MNTRPTNVPGLPTRRAALQILDAVTRTGQPLDQAVIPATRGLESADRALAIAIAQEVLRWGPDLDLLIDSQTQLPLAKDAKARMVLRMALAQILRLGTPPHAAISTALPLVDKGPRRLVHGVLGSLWRLQPKLADAPTLLPEVALRWEAAWGKDMVAASRTALAEPPMLDLTLKNPADTAKWASELGGDSLASGHVRLPRGQAVETLPGYAEGEWWVQDLAASLPVRAMGEGKGRTVLDLCAAPGGKTMQLAAQGWAVTALDLSAKRLARLSDNMERTGFAVETVTADLRKWDSEQQFDAVLLDAPCSATGTFRRHPDVLHRIGPKQIAELTGLQSAMLDRAAQWVKPGGMLVYATCSLEPEEGEVQAADFRARHPEFVPQECDRSALPDGIASTDGMIRTLPTLLTQDGGLDGFFIACWKRAE